MKKIIHLSIVIANFLSIGSVASPASSPWLQAGTASGAPGATVSMPIIFTAGSVGVASLQCRVSVPSGWSIASASVGPAATNALKTVNLNSSNGILIVFGVNQNTIATGVVANVQIKIPSSANSASYPVTMSGVIFSASNGASVQGAAPVNGSIIVKSTKPTIPSISSFTAAPASITPGSSSRLSWNVTGATSLSISPKVGVVSGTSVSVSPTATTTYTLTATNSVGSATATAKVTVTSTVVPTITSFNASPASIAAGSSSTLSWNVTGASGLSISPNVGTVTGTSISVRPSATTTYTLTASNSGGSSRAMATVTVTGKTAAPKIASFGALPASINAGGYSSLLWSVTGATNLSISPGVGSVTGTAIVVSPTATTTYTLTASNSGGSATATTTITVRGSSPLPAITSFSASPASIAAGAPSKLAWNATGANSLTISPTVGSVSGTSVSVSPAATTTYTLTATNSVGSVTAATKVTVTSAAVPSITSFSASPISITAGAFSTLSWSVAGATSLSISPNVGAVTGTSVSVSPTATTIYTLTATNGAGSATRTASVTVKGSGAPPTIGSFGAVPASIKPGGFSALLWSVTGATSLSISPGVGTVTGTVVVVSPTVTTTYTLAASNSGGSTSTTTTITVTP